MKDNFLTAVATLAHENVTLGDNGQGDYSNTALTNEANKIKQGTRNLVVWLSGCYMLLCGCTKSLLELGSMSLGKICRT